MFLRAQVNIGFVLVRRSCVPSPYLRSWHRLAHTSDRRTARRRASARPWITSAWSPCVLCLQVAVCSLEWAHCARWVVFCSLCSS